MLILCRHIGESIKIGDDVTVTVVAIQGHTTRLGISAPKDVEVDREEIRERKRAEQRTGVDGNQ